MEHAKNETGGTGEAVEDLGRMREAGKKERERGKGEGEEKKGKRQGAGEEEKGKKTRTEGKRGRK